MDRMVSVLFLLVLTLSLFIGCETNNQSDPPTLNADASLTEGDSRVQDPEDMSPDASGEFNEPDHMMSDLMDAQVMSDATTEVDRDVVESELSWLGTRIEFLSMGEATDFLGQSDDFTQALSAYDRGLRIGTIEMTTESDILAHAASQAQSFSPDDRARWEGAIMIVSDALEGFNLELPPTINIIQTSGEEEFNLPYTRRNAIILPRNTVHGDASVYLLAHELFHIATRYDIDLRGRTFPMIGFYAVPPLERPSSLIENWITNPDAFSLSHAIDVEVASEDQPIVPVLQGRLPLDDALGRDITQIVNIVLLSTDGITTWPMAQSNYVSLASRNTNYILHPEEVVADNFSFLILQRANLSNSVNEPSTLRALEAELSLP